MWGCCQGRVKRVATCPQSPSYCWSASEDGCVRRLDIREPHNCSGRGRCRNVIIDVRTHSRLTAQTHSIQCKCIDINPVRSEQIAVGTSDQYTRIYDTRLCSFRPLLASSPSNQSQVGDLSCIACFSPGHLNTSPVRNQSSCNSFATTYVSFSSDGQDLMVNLSGEQVNMFYLLFISTARLLACVSFSF